MAPDGINEERAIFQEAEIMTTRIHWSPWWLCSVAVLSCCATARFGLINLEKVPRFYYKRHINERGK